jgi:diadenosine tetraphosphate (Ap4A) HIT family hydrolase
VTLERLWAGWRAEYLEGGAGEEGDGCVLCRILRSGEPPESTYVVWRDDRCAAVLNAYPYTSGHLMVMPVRHAAGPDDLDGEESASLWAAVTTAVRALRAAYRPEGLNLGANLGQAAGAGVPGHFHVHCVPRWNGDTNFMTATAEVRVLPESLPATFRKVRDAWPPG